MVCFPGLFAGLVPVLRSLLAGFVWLTAPQEQTGTLAEGSWACMHNPLNMVVCLELQSTDLHQNEPHLLDNNHHFNAVHGNIMLMFFFRIILLTCK